MDVTVLRQNVRYISKPARDKWIVAADLGQAYDPTAICVLNHRIVPLQKWKWINDSTQKQEFTEHFDVRHLERLPLGLPYPEQVSRVSALLARPPLNAGAKLVIDETGVGRAVGDIFNSAGLRPDRVTITAGLEETRHGGDRFHVAKSILMSCLEARMHTRELRIAPDIGDAGALKEEMKDFERNVTAAGRATWGARVGAHDDLVLAVAIAVWYAKSMGEFSHHPLL